MGDQAAVRDAYDRVADLYADHFRATEPELAVELAMVQHFATLLGAGAEVLDAGCGAGRMMPVLAELGCRVQGVDLSPGMIRRARADHPDFPSQAGTPTALPFGDGVFDGVFSWYSIIHSEDADLPLIFGEMRRVLRPGGLALVAFQVGEGPREVGEAFRSRGEDVELLRYHRSTRLVADALGSAGFQTVATMERAPAGSEREPQAVMIAQRIT